MAFSSEIKSRSTSRNRYRVR